MHSNKVRNESQILFSDIAVSDTELHKLLKRSLDLTIKITID